MFTSKAKSRQRTHTKSDTEQYLDGQAIKCACDKLVTNVPLSQIENNPQHATDHPRWKHTDQSERSQLLDLLRQAIDIIRTQLEKK